MSLIRGECVSDELITPVTEDVPLPVPIQIPAEAPPHRSNLLREIIETALLTAIIFLIVNAATGRFRIDGSSMEPNLHDGEYVLIDKVSYLLHAPERGDVIVFVRPGVPDYIKRVIGLPGDTVEVRGGQVVVNGVMLEEPYITQAIQSDQAARQIESGRYFVMGDNRNNSSDSRSFGTVPLADIVGRAWVVYWPPSEWAAVPHYTYAALQSE
jgi:signal peptidase I